MCVYEGQDTRIWRALSLITWMGDMMFACVPRFSRHGRLNARLMTR